MADAVTVIRFRTPVPLTFKDNSQSMHFMTGFNYTINNVALCIYIMMAFSFVDTAVGLFPLNAWSVSCPHRGEKEVKVGENIHNDNPL